MTACGSNEDPYRIKDYSEAIKEAESPFDTNFQRTSADLQGKLDEYSKDKLTEMANQTGDAGQEVVPDVQFWEEVSNNGRFAAFQKALKGAKNDEDRWKIADEFPQIAARSGMIDALAPRQDTTKVPAEQQ